MTWRVWLARSIIAVTLALPVVQIGWAWLVILVTVGATWWALVTLLEN